MNFPPEMDEVAKDLVDRMLQVDPNARLGMSTETPGMSNLAQIRSHPFFKDLNFEEFRDTPVPVPQFIIEQSRKQTTMKKIQK